MSDDAQLEHALPHAVIRARMVAITGDERWRQLRRRLIAGGKSNLTFEVSSAAGSVILRRPPTGARLPSAHDMAREARVQAALAATPTPVPRILYVDASGEDLGVPYYVMEKVEGLVIRDRFPAGYADSPARRRAVARALVDTLGVLHSTDPRSIGLGDFGRPAGFMERQVRRWTSQWDQSRTKDVSVVDELIERVRSMRFGPGRPSLVHGDFRLDNCLIDNHEVGRVNAVLDWELATLGDPLADLSMLLFYWVGPGEPVPALTPAITALPGFPSRAEVADQYASITGADLDSFLSYVAFAHLKFAVIAAGIARRADAGAMAGQEFGDLSGEVERIASAGLDLLRHKEI